MKDAIHLVKHQPNFAHLNTLRGVSALLVMFGHLHDFILRSYRDFTHFGVIDRLIGWSALFGHSAVVIFFVLSGFVITRSVVLDYRARQFALWRYAAKRLTRLWLVLLPALLATAFWDLLAQRAGNPNWSSSQLAIGPVDDSAFAFFGNASFLQGIAVPVYGSNGPLWSLSYEFWYYVVFGLCFYIGLQAPSWRAAGCGILIVIICYFVSAPVLEYGVIWLLGVGAYVLWENHGGLKRFVSHPVAVIVLLFLLAAMVPVGLHDKSILYWVDLFIGVDTALLVLGLAHRSEAGMAYRRISTFLADISYTVYLFHYPFLCAVVTIFIYPRKYTNADRGYLVMFAVGVATMLYCITMHQLFEKHDRKVREWVMAKLELLPQYFVRNSLGA